MTKDIKLSEQETRPKIWFSLGVFLLFDFKI